jgi:hypothetical protein
MATPQKDESSGIISAISKFAGTAVGTAVVTGKRIIGSTAPSGKVVSGKATRRAPVKKRKKVVKRKRAGSAGKSGASRKKPVQSPAKKKKGAIPGKKTKRRKVKKKKTAKGKVASHSQEGLTSKSTEISMPIEKQKSQQQMLIAKAETAGKDFTGAKVSSKKNRKGKGTAKLRKSSIPIIEYDSKAGKAVVSAVSTG